MPTLNINGQRVKVDDSFLSLPPEQQNATVDEIAQSFGGGMEAAKDRIREGMGDETAQFRQQQSAEATATVARAGAGALPRNAPNYVDEFQNEQSAAAQGTSPVVRQAFGEGSGSFTRRPSGPAVETDSGPAFIDPATGETIPVDTKKHVVLQDPESGRSFAFDRSADTDESKPISLFRLMAPGLLSQTPGGTARAAPRVANAAKAAEQERRASLVDDFRQSGVRATAPAISDNRVLQGTAKQVSETIPGAPLRKALTQSLDDTAKASERVAAGYGAARSSTEGGQQAVQGASRQSRVIPLPGMKAEEIASLPASQTSFATRSGALYDTAYSKLPQGAAGDLNNTAQAVQRIVSQRQRALIDPKIGGKVRPDLADNLAKPGQRLSMEDMRRLRTDIGQLVGKADANIDGAEVRQLYASLTRDMQDLARQGGDDAVRAFQKADRYYSAGKSRMDGVFAKVLNADSPEKAFEQIYNLSTTSGGANSNALRALKQGLSRDEWGDIASTFIARLGTPSAGTAEQGAFSVTQFVTNFAKMTPEARAVIFGGSGRRELQTSLERLARVAGAQKTVERLANTSRSGNMALNVGGSAASGVAIMLGDIVTPLVAAGGPYAVSKFLASPKAVDWLAKAVTLKQRRAPNAELTAHSERLRQIIANDNVLAEALGQIPSVGKVAADSEQGQAR